MKKTWRWFGQSDPVTLDMLRQIGVEGIVTSLHGIPPGEVWSDDQISANKRFIERYGLEWSVVESLPVSEEIKRGGPLRDLHIERYRESLSALGRCGIHTVCYNFMPVLDWARTSLEHPLPDGTYSLYFDYTRFAYFDIFILGREGAEKDFPEEIVKRAGELDKVITPEEKYDLIYTIIIKTQAFLTGYVVKDDKAPVETFKRLLTAYDGISKDDLRANAKYFLEAIMPVCREWDINMCIHPDDPPLSTVFGLPRICTDAEDIRWLLSAVDDFHNGLTFCAGSLSSGAQNDVTAMAREFAGRTHFVHLRSCELLDGGDFIEAPHTGGRADLVELCRIFIREGRNVPMRVDHGKLMLGDDRIPYNPGYSFHGRMLALGQVEGIMTAVRNEIKNQLI